jgi:hypothetical protein
MADAVRGRGLVPVSAEDGRATVALLERCLESSTVARSVSA